MLVSVIIVMLCLCVVFIVVSMLVELLLVDSVSSILLVWFSVCIWCVKMDWVLKLVVMLVSIVVLDESENVVSFGCLCL